MVLLDKGLSPSALARLVQQLFDLGNYRKLSLLGWPLTRQALGQLHSLEAFMKLLLVIHLHILSEAILDKTWDYNPLIVFQSLNKFCIDPTLLNN